jgi:hypothetical protein
MSWEASASPRTWRRSFWQMAVRRRNGDQVFITGDSGRVVQGAKSLLRKIARRSGMKMLEVAEMAELAAVVRENLGAPDVVRGLLRAPHPDDTRQDVGVLEERYIADLAVANAVIDDEEVEVEVVAWLAKWHLGWSRYFAFRHPNAECRAYFAAQFAKDFKVRRPQIEVITRRGLDA